MRKWKRAFVRVLGCSPEESCIISLRISSFINLSLKKPTVNFERIKTQFVTYSKVPRGNKVYISKNEQNRRVNRFNKTDIVTEYLLGLAEVPYEAVA
ncbi:hypothetical protein TNCT_596271 [Trichonephila clavata]|uniref:Uncharacterized protein n=1 Tax=Trichonephila clavata TaxID=2740835 RepID=A0A8X6HF89_TRICU|nr:hypothetical protein TNCT_596271 [Trichonephila clavata]